MIPLIHSTFYKEGETKKLLTNFISDAKYLSFGKECEQFEQSFAKWQGRKYCVFVNSGSSANLALIQALLNLGRIENKVGFSALTWSTNVMPLIQLGLIPVPLDVEVDTLNVSSKKLLPVIDSLSVVFLTNLLGLCDDIDEIKRLCDEKNVLLLEDNCESLGSVYKGKKLGNYGLASTFSFYVGHHMSTIEGGAICTDDEELADMLRIVRAHGWDRNLAPEKKTNQSFYSRYTFYDLGYNLRPTEIQGYIGNTQLPYLDEVVQKRESNFVKLDTPIDTYYPLRYTHMDTFSSFAFPFICKSTEQRDALVERCKGKIEIRPIVGGDITQQPFFKKYAFSPVNPNADLIHKQGLYIGNNPELTDSELELIKEVVNG